MEIVFVGVVFSEFNLFEMAQWKCFVVLRCDEFLGLIRRAKRRCVIGEIIRTNLQITFDCLGSTDSILHG